MENHTVRWIHQFKCVFPGNERLARELDRVTDRDGFDLMRRYPTPRAILPRSG